METVQVVLRTAALALYVGGLFWPCLSHCFAPNSSAATHACCPRPASTQGQRLSDRSTDGSDCCSITGHLRSAALDVMAAPAPAVMMHAERQRHASTAVLPSSLAPSTPSPPLRI